MGLSESSKFQPISLVDDIVYIIVTVRLQNLQVSCLLCVCNVNVCVCKLSVAIDIP